MRHLSLAIGSFLLTFSFYSMAGEITCGTHVITDDGTKPATKSEVRHKCGKPHEEHGNEWHYKKSGGLTYKLHFNDNGELESISAH